MELKKNRGFTLIELMLVMALMGIMVAPLLYMEVYYAKGFFSCIYRQDLTEAGKRSLEWLAKDVRSAMGVKEKWGEETASGQKIILETGQGVVIYSFEKEKRLLSRREYGFSGADPVITQMALHVDRFLIEPREANPKVYHIRLDLSREVLHFKEEIKMNGVAARRVHDF